MRSTLSIRGVPEGLRTWLDESVHKGVSQNEFILQILQKAYERRIEPTLYDGLVPPPKPTLAAVPFRFIDLFAGIGGFRIGLTKAGGKCVFTSEWDRNSQRTYRAWFHDEQVWGDINTINPEDIPDHDILAAGFPCQPFSIAGVSKKNSLGQAHGFECEKQGHLFFKICEIAEKKRPPVLLLENVKNLKSHDKGMTWKVIKSELEKLRYKVFNEIIDASSWVPQHRERIFIVCFDREIFGDNPPFQYPDPPTKAPKLGDILETNPPAKYTLTDHLWDYLQKYAQKHREKGNGFGFGLVGPENITRTLSARYYKDGSEILIKQNSNKNPRRLTPREAARLMGYDESRAKLFGHEDGFPIVVSDTQAYRQFGNSVVPAVVEAVAMQILEVIRWKFDQTGGCLMKTRFKPTSCKDNMRLALRDYLKDSKNARRAESGTTPLLHVQNTGS